MPLDHRRRARALWLAGALLLAPQSAAAQRTLGIQPTANAQTFAEESGRRLTFVCPATDGASGYVYGTDVYAEISAICAAAIHAGVLRPKVAGAVSIVMGPPTEAFKASYRNGVKSLPYGASRASFTFVRDHADESGQIAWYTVWNLVPADFFEPVTVSCPGEGKPDRTIWGTDVYITDSAICVAAVHAGVITAKSGGPVVVARAKPLKEYPGSERAGIASRSWSAWSDAFSVAAPASAPPPDTSAGSGPAPLAAPVPRTISLAGLALTAVAGGGSYAGGPRTVTLDGFALTGATSSGSTAGISGRTIATPGFALTGAP